MHKLMWLLAANNPWGLSANEIGVPKSTGNVGQILANVTQLLMSIIGGLAILFIIWGGIRYVYSRGNPKDTQVARETILYAVVGLVVAIAAYAIVGYISGSINK